MRACSVSRARRGFGSVAGAGARGGGAEGGGAAGPAGARGGRRFWRGLYCHMARRGGGGGVVRGRLLRQLSTSPSCPAALQWFWLLAAGQGWPSIVSFFVLMTLFHLWDLPGDVLAAPESASGLDRCHISLSRFRVCSSLNTVCLAFSFLVSMSFGVHTTFIHRSIRDDFLLVSVDIGTYMLCCAVVVADVRESRYWKPSSGRFRFQLYAEAMP